MANNKSAKKRIKIAEKNRLQNRYYKSSIKTFSKKINMLLNQFKENKQSELLLELQATVNLCTSRIDKAIKKNIIHKNTGARKKSQLTKLIKIAKNT